MADPGIWPYLLRAKKPSIASYRLCHAVGSLLDQEPATVFDVGANQGQFAGAATWRFPNSEIVSFEPVPRTFEILEKNTRGIDRLRLVQSALGAHKGQLNFFENTYSHASSALRINQAMVSLNPETADTKTIVVPVTTLDDFSAVNSWARPILLKLDVQGFEKQVLEGGSKFLENTDYLLFECSYRRLYDGEPLYAAMYEYVSALGFDLVAPVGFLQDRNHVTVQSDLLWRRR